MGTGTSRQPGWGPSGMTATPSSTRDHPHPIPSSTKPDTYIRLAGSNQPTNRKPKRLSCPPHRALCDPPFSRHSSYPDHLVEVIEPLPPLAAGSLRRVCPAHFVSATGPFSAYPRHLSESPRSPSDLGLRAQADSMVIGAGRSHRGGCGMSAAGNNQSGRVITSSSVSFACQSV